MTIQASVTGRLTGDPDLQYGQSGKARATFSIAVNHATKDQQGQWQDTGATFLRVTLWEHQAESAAEKLQKGMRVTARGRIETRAYQAQDGSEGKSLEMRVDDIGQALDKYPPKAQNAPQPQQPAADPWAAQPAAQPQSQGWDTPATQPAAWDQPQGDQGPIPF